MLGKLITTRRGNLFVNAALTAVGVILVIVVSDTRFGIILFLAATTLESGLFTLVYGLRADWRQVDAARAVFWAVFAYFGVALHALTLYINPMRFWWTDDLRELLYMGLTVAGSNLLLTLVRVLGPRVWRTPLDMEVEQGREHG